MLSRTTFRRHLNTSSLTWAIRAVIFAVVGCVGLMGLPARAVDQACCDLESVDRTCFDDTIGSGSVCAAEDELGAGTTCTSDCPCDTTCNTCVSKQAGNLSHVEVQLVGTPFFDGTNTTFTYRVCQISGFALSHWVLGLPSACCSEIVSASGGGTSGTCGTDPTTGLFGLKFETGSGVPTCSGPCGSTGNLYTITFSGDVAGNGCIKIANKANGAEDTSTACIKGPNAECGSVCVSDSECNDGIACTTDDCDPSNPNADSDGCVHTVNHSSCDDGNECTTDLCAPDNPSSHPVTGCLNTPVPDNTPCDGVPSGACDEQDVCINGTCVDRVKPQGFVCRAAVNECDVQELCDGVSKDCPADVCRPAETPCTADGNDCTRDVCDGVCGCTHPPVALGTACGDDGTPCTRDECDGAGTCVHSPDDSRCDDSKTCTTNDCNPGAPEADGDGCVYTPNHAACDDGVSCTNDRCDPDDPAANPGSGCVNFANDTKCMDDGSFCNGPEVCNPISGCVSSGNPCVLPTPLCCESADVCAAECCVDADCDNGEFCDGMETCVGGVCMPGTDPCPADDCGCTSTVCEEATDTCVHVPNDGFCKDALFCNGQEFCNPSLGSGTCCDVVPPCDPSLVCDEDLDRCVDCLPPPNPNSCDDMLFCNGLETCVDGACADGADPCSPDAFTCTDDSCNESTDMCEHIPNDGACDDAVSCTTDVCDPMNPAANPITGCVNSPLDASCDDGNECTDDSCNPGDPGAGPDGCTHTPKAAGSPCGNQIRLGPCDNPDICDGAGQCVPNFEPSTEVCRPAVGECDVTEFCTGMSEQCPSDGCTPAGVGCTDDGNACTDDVCNGSCACTHPPLPAGTSCGNPTPLGPCDNPDMCDGMGGCSPNLKPSSVECRAAENECDIAEFCTGTSALCPPDQCQPAGTGCTDDGNECTSDACDGSCTCVHPPRPIGTACGNATPQGVCDNPDMCDGMGACAPNLKPATRECRAAINECDLAEFCSGTSPDCPTDACQPPGTGCTNDGNACTADACDGMCNCGHPALPSGTPCGNSTPQGVCDNPDVCNGTGMCSQNLKPATEQCRAALNECDLAEFCTGSAVDCPPDECKTSGTPCSDDGNSCTSDFCTACTCTHLNAGGICGACCLPNLSCIEDVSAPDCSATGGTFVGVGSNCDTDTDGDGTADPCDVCADADGDNICDIDDPCPKGEDLIDTDGDGTPDCFEGIPTVSMWGLLVLGLLLLTSWKIRFGRPTGPFQA